MVLRPSSNSEEQEQRPDLMRRDILERSYIHGVATRETCGLANNLAAQAIFSGRSALPEDCDLSYCER